VSIDDVAAGAGPLVDAREPARYSGLEEPVDPRPGHIPGAVSVACRGNLDATGHWLDPESLRGRFAAAGIEAGDSAVCYCGSGVTACHNLLALERAGLPSGRLYPGSWSQWSSDPRRPATTGPQP
jgi:thiosulfate/3-mercaptopyruvate sulfurtransferase